MGELVNCNIENVFRGNAPEDGSTIWSEKDSLMPRGQYLHIRSNWLGSFKSMPLITGCKGLSCAYSVSLSPRKCVSKQGNHVANTRRNKNSVGGCKDLIVICRRLSPCSYTQMPDPIAFPMPQCHWWEPSVHQHLLERNETRRVGGTNTGSSVLDRSAAQSLASVSAFQSRYTY